MAILFSLCHDNFCTKANTGDKIKYTRLPRNRETKQQKTKENTTEVTY